MTAQVPDDVVGVTGVTEVVAPADVSATEATESTVTVEPVEVIPSAVVQDMGGTFTPIVHIPYRLRAEIANYWDMPRCRAKAGGMTCLEVVGHDEINVPHTAWAGSLPATVWDARGHWHPIGQMTCSLAFCPTR